MEPPAAFSAFGDSPVEHLLGEIVACHQRLRFVAEQVHGRGEISSGRRAVLRDLARGGPRTVPQLARTRPVSRQYMQGIINELADEGLVASLENPGHRRSVLIEVTELGLDELARIDQRESGLFQRLSAVLEPRQMDQAAVAVRVARQALEQISKELLHGTESGPSL